jgi:hypothetical protein
MFRDHDGVFVGRCGIHRWTLDGREEVELGYIVRPELWRTGYATEMGAAVVDHAFSALRLPALVGFTRPDNLPSRRVLEKLAFKYERTFVSHGEVGAVPPQQCRTARVGRCCPQGRPQRHLLAGCRTRRRLWCRPRSTTAIARRESSCAPSSRGCSGGSSNRPRG